MHTHFVYYIWTHRETWFEYPIWGIIHFICGKVSILSTEFVISIYAHVCIIMAAFGTVMIIAMSIKLNQIKNLLYPKNLRMPSQSAYKIVFKRN